VSMGACTDRPCLRTTKRAAVRRDRKPRIPAPRPGRDTIAPHFAAAHEILAAIVTELLTPGDHTFADIRAEFLAWCERMRVARVSDKMLAQWLRGAGLTSRRAGHAKVTVYFRPATLAAA
jgi:hypothetical protein